MFDFIRSHQRLMQLILLILVVPSFVFLGISGYSFVTADPALAEIGKLEVTKEEFIQAQRNQLQQMQESSQGRFDPALLDNPQARQTLMDQLIDYKIQIAIASDNHFSASDNALRKVIATMPQFQEGGQFSADRYNDFLGSYGISPRDFEASKRGEIAISAVLDPIAGTAALPKPVLDSIKVALTEERTIQLKSFNANDFKDQVNVSNDEIKSWYDANQDDLRLPKQVEASYIVLDEAAAMASVPAIEESKLQEYYEQNKSTYVVPGRVNASHILIKLPSGAADDAKEKALEEANNIAKRLQADSADFAKVAQKESQDAGTARDGGELGWIQRGSLPLDMEQALFALKEGQVSDPVKGPDGYHILKANQVQEEHGETFAEARVKVEEEVHKQLAAERFADMATNLTSLVYDDPTSLEPAAKALGVEVRTATGISRDGLLAADEVGPNAAEDSDDSAILGDVRVRQALFSNQVLNDRQNSGVIEISSDTMVAVRVNKVIDAHVPELDIVNNKIKSKLVAQHSLDLAKQAGADYLKQLQSSANTAKAADADTATETNNKLLNGFSDPVKISRLDTAGLNKSVIDAALSITGDKLPYFGKVELPNAYTVIMVDKVTPGSTDKPALNGLSSQLSQVWGNSEEQALLKQLRKEMGVVITEKGQQLINEGDGSTE